MESSLGRLQLELYKEIKKVNLLFFISEFIASKKKINILSDHGLKL